MKSMNQQLEMMNKMIGDDRGDMSAVKMPEHMQMMKIMNDRLDMMQVVMKQIMGRQDQDD